MIIIKLFLNIVNNAKPIFQLIKWNSEVGKTEKMAKTRKINMKIVKTCEKTHTIVKKSKKDNKSVPKSGAESQRLYIERKKEQK